MDQKNIFIKMEIIQFQKNLHKKSLIHLSMYTLDYKLKDIDNIIKCFQKFEKNKKLMTYSIISKFSWDEWDDLVNNSNQYNLFNTSYFLKLTNSKNCYLIKYKNQIIAGVNVNDENSKDGLNFFIKD